jgi:hypothetical protein
MQTRHQDLILWILLLVAFGAGFLLPPRYFALFVPLSPILALYLILRLHGVLYNFDQAGSLSRTPAMTLLVHFLNWFVTAPSWFRRIGAVLCLASTLGLFFYLAPQRSNTAPKTDGRESSNLDQRSTAPAVGRER